MFSVRFPAIFFALLGLLLTLHCTEVADTAARTPAALTLPTTPQLPDSIRHFIRDYDRYFADAMVRTNTPGAALVIVLDGQVLFQRGYGRRQIDRPDTVDTHTIFRIGSLSKGFAGILTGMMVQEKSLQWDDKVQQHYPDFTLRDKKQAQRVRVSHLLSHTSGLPYHAFTNLIEEGYDIPRIVTQYFPKAPVSGREGVFFAYQNAAFCVVEEVLQRIKGRTYQQLLVEKIFYPAGMNDASVDFASIQSATNKALPHFSTGIGWNVETISPLYYNSAAAGGVNASIDDMGHWLLLLLGEKPDIIADSTLQTVFRPVVKTDKERRIMPHWIGRDKAAYAMGWRVLDTGNDTIIYHGGYVNGFRGEIAFNRRTGLGICALFNAHTELGSQCVQSFFEQWDKKR
jgi:beta-lactamase class C